MFLLLRMAFSDFETIGYDTQTLTSAQCPRILGNNDAVAAKQKKKT